MTDSSKTFIRTKYNGNNPKVRKYSYRNGNAYNSKFWLIAWEVSYKPNNQSQKHNSNNQNNDINLWFTSNTKFMLLQLRQRKFYSIHIQIFATQTDKANN